MDDTEGYTIDERNFAQEVKRLRDERGWSLALMAEKLVDAGAVHVSAMTVSRIEKLQRPVRMIEAHAYSEVFGRTTWSLSHPQDVDRNIADNDQRIREASVAHRAIAVQIDAYAALVLDWPMAVVEAERQISELPRDSPQVPTLTYQHDEMMALLKPKFDERFNTTFGELDRARDEH